MDTSSSSFMVAITDLDTAATAFDQWVANAAYDDIIRHFRAIAS